MSEYAEFLCRAKKATYAGKGREVSSSRLKSHDLKYSEGNKMYYDTYIGESDFAGEEALWIDNSPVWSMNYIGRVLDERFSGDFLKAALLNVPTEMPYRGPAEYREGDYVYKCSVTGEFEWFQGYEQIFYNDTPIYECFFHGGKIHTVR